MQDYFGCITDSRHFRHLVSDSDQMDEGNTSSCLGKLMPRTGKRNENINFMQKGNLQHSSWKMNPVCKECHAFFVVIPFPIFLPFFHSLLELKLVLPGEYLYWLIYGFCQPTRTESLKWLKANIYKEMTLFSQLKEERLHFHTNSNLCKRETLIDRFP